MFPHVGCDATLLFREGLGTPFYIGGESGKGKGVALIKDNECGHRIELLSSLVKPGEHPSYTPFIQLDGGRVPAELRPWGFGGPPKFKGAFWKSFRSLRVWTTGPKRTQYGGKPEEYPPKVSIFYSKPQFREAIKYYQIVRYYRAPFEMKGYSKTMLFISCEGAQVFNLICLKYNLNSMLVGIRTR